MTVKKRPVGKALEATALAPPAKRAKRAAESHSVPDAAPPDTPPKPPTDKDTCGADTDLDVPRRTAQHGERIQLAPQTRNAPAVPSADFITSVRKPTRQGEPAVPSTSNARDDSVDAEAWINNTEDEVPSSSRRGGTILGSIFSPVFSLWNSGCRAIEAGAGESIPEIPERDDEIETVSGAKENTDSLLMAMMDPDNIEEQIEDDENMPTSRICQVEYADEENMDEDDFLEDCFDPYLFIKNLPPLEECVEDHRKLLLPAKTRRAPRVTLVLDLDETLVHSCLKLEGPPFDFNFLVDCNQQKHRVNVRRRPGLEEFLIRVAEKFEVVVFTASQGVYANQLLNILDPNRQLVRHRIFREDCVYVEGNYVKDLSILGRDLKQVILVDNSPQAYAFQIDNGIPIETWTDDPSDSELLAMLPFLETLAKVDDVRPAIASHYKQRERVSNSGTPKSYRRV